MTEKIEKTELLIVAAILARTNFGYEKPGLFDVQCAIRRPPTSAGNAVIHFCEQYMENDKHQSLFEQECEMWIRILTDDPEDARKSYPEHFALYAEAKNSPSEIL